MGSEAQDPKEAFEAWLLHRVARSVEAGEVSADLLTELCTEMERARELAQEKGHTLAVQDIAERFGLPVDHAEKILAPIEVQPSVTQQLLLRRIVEAWLRTRRRPNGQLENTETTSPGKGSPPFGLGLSSRQGAPPAIAGMP
jgi:hypothetical protein